MLENQYEGNDYLSTCNVLTYIARQKVAYFMYAKQIEIIIAI